MEAMSQLPWLSQPVTLHYSRDPGMCMMTPEQCTYKQRYWVYWYEADHRYAIPTIALILSVIILFSIFHALNLLAPATWTTSKRWRQAAAISRWASYRRWTMGSWRTQSMGTYMLGFVGFVFFTVMTLAAQPYYWPNTREVSYGNSPPIATRAGWMALACMPFILILATKANAIASLIGTSHENLIVWHNWLAWAMYILALIHTFPFIVYNIWAGTIVEQWNTGGLWLTGVVALLAQTWLTFFSIRWLRERYYEVFKATHFFAAIVFVIFFFFHCDHILTAWDYFIAGAVLYVSSWLYSQCRIFFEHGLGHKAYLTLETEEMLRISIDTNADWHAGQHIYLRFLGMGAHAFASHPFTICSLPGGNTEGEKRNQMVFYVKARGGFTRRLGSLASSQPGAQLRVLLDGPYGGMQSRSFDGFDHTIIIGGGAGAGFTLGLVHHYLKRLQREPGCTSKMTLVVSSRDQGMRHWYLEALASMNAGERMELKRLGSDESSGEIKHPALTVRIHDTSLEISGATSSADEDQAVKGSVSHEKKAKSEAEIPRIPGIDLSIEQGRPDLLALGREAVAEEGMSVGMVVCGPTSMLQDVGDVAASAQANIMKGGAGASEVWLHQESFSS